MSRKNYKWKRDKVEEAVKNSTNYSETLRYLGRSHTGGNNGTIRKYIKLWGIRTSHFLSNADKSNRKCPKCDSIVPHRINIGGKQKLLNNRKYCLDCSPFGSHNQRKTDISEEEREKRDRNARLVNDYRRLAKQTCIEYCGGKCIICGYNRCVSGLVFHHLNSNEKDFSLSGKAWSWIRVKKEIDKCVLLCQNCHCEIHEAIIEVPKNLPKRIVPDNSYTRGRPEKQPQKETLGRDHLRINKRKVERPPYDQLLKEIEETSYVQVGKKYGISNVAVHKWIKMYEKYGDKISLK